MRIVDTIAEIRAACDAARRRGSSVGFVPTMGFFHAGHRSLMEAARRDNDLVVVSHFVNPTQFGPTEDLAAYPRDIEADAALAAGAGVDLLFMPTVAEMYPRGAPRTTVHVAELTAGMCGAARPTHFDGVTTVVAKLFAIVGSSRAYFGRKDFQQLAVVRRMIADLDLPVEVVGCPLVRESDGLALSSRNAYLTPAERAAAPRLYGSLVLGAEMVRAGARDSAAIIAAIRAAVAPEPALELEYVEVRDSETLDALDRLSDSFVIGVAARVGRARLIDNMVLEIDGDAVAVDAGVCVPPSNGPAPAVNP